MPHLPQPFSRSEETPAVPHVHDNAPTFIAPTPKLPPRELRLDIVVGTRCPICRENLKNIDSLRRELPDVRVRVIDMDAPDGEKPKNVIAIPTFLLNGYVVATGNPNVAELKKFIRSLST
jgi:protein-disulfide isomerase